MLIDSQHYFEEGDEDGGEPVTVDNQSIETDQKRLHGHANYVPVESNDNRRKTIDDSYTATQQVNAVKGETNSLRPFSNRDDSNKGSEAVQTITKRTYKAKGDKIFNKMSNANPKYQLGNDKKLNMVIIES